MSQNILSGISGNVNGDFVPDLVSLLKIMHYGRGGEHMTPRCGWVTSDPLYIEYHDTEWGAPEYDDRKLFELLILEGAQAGLSWLTILKKREWYRQAFARFDARKISKFDDHHIAQLLRNPGIVRNRLKIAATIQNARAFLALQKTSGSFSQFLWQFVGGAPKQNAWKALQDVPARTAESDAMSKALTAQGFKFVGSTICYALMQAAGMVNDHL